MAGVGCYLAALLYKREIGLYFIVGLLPLRSIVEKLYVFPFGKNVVDVYLITLLLLCFIKPKQQHDAEYFGALSPMRPILVYVILTYLYLWIGSLIIGIDLPIGLDNERLMNWKNHMILPALFFITLNMIQEKRQIIILSSVMLLSIFLVDFNFYQNFTHTGGHYLDNRRSRGIFVWLGPNELGAFFAEYSFIILGLLFLCKSMIWRWPLLLLLGLNFYCLIYSFSRGAYVAFVAAFLFMLLVRKNIKTMALIMLLAVFWTSFVPTSVVERIEMTETEEGSLDSSAAGRVERWEHGMNLFLRNPVGYGFDTVRFLGFTGYSGRDNAQGDPHNRYVKFLVEMGIPGITIFLYLFYLAFKNGWRLYSDAEDEFTKGLGLGFAATVVACMVTNMFGDRWTYEMLSGFYFVFWALVVRATIIVQMEKQQSLKAAA